jgi:hypothetical protein
MKVNVAKLCAQVKQKIARFAKKMPALGGPVCFGGWLRSDVERADAMADVEHGAVVIAAHLIAALNPLLDEERQDLSLRRRCRHDGGCDKELFHIEILSGGAPILAPLSDFTQAIVQARHPSAGVVWLAHHAAEHVGVELAATELDDDAQPNDVATLHAQGDGFARLI